MAAQKSEFPDLIVVAHEEGRTTQPERGLTRRVLAYNDKLFLAEHRMEKGWQGALHSHPHEQMVYVVSGHIEVRSGGITRHLRAGDTFVVRGGVEHGASAYKDSVVVDVFTPCREDYLV